MTRATGWIDRNVGRITIVLAIGTCACLIGLGYLNSQVRAQARDGSAARLTQCKVRPVTIKKENWWHASGVTSEQERQVVLSALPSPAECAALFRK